MVDEVTARDDGQKFTPHPEGQFAARCVDVLNLGDRLEQFAGKPPRISRKCALVFDAGQRNPETDEPMTVSMEFTVSMFERSGLRLFLESWRGRSYTEEQAEAGVPLHKLHGVVALLSVEHKKSASGRTYTKIKTISPLPSGLPAPEADGYQRAEFWDKRKEEYAAEVAKYRSLHVSKPAEEPEEPGEDDDLPF